MHILIAPNAFKHSLSAVDAAAAIAAGLGASILSGTWAACPVGDGGDGTAEVLLRARGGERRQALARDPLGRHIPCEFVLLDEGRTAVIELAEASGLRRLQPHELDPLRASTAGTGDLLKCALDCGVREIILCVGGSATVDGGSGLLQSLGVGFLDSAGRPLDCLPGQLPALDAIDLTRLDPRLDPRRGERVLTVLCDVTNPLLGARGAAAIFGPQKGATGEAVGALETALTRFSEVVLRHTGEDIARLPRGGAAGGVAAGLYGLLGARLVGGIEYVLQLIDFDAALEGADLVITGEGAIDDQTIDGKAPWGVALRARARGAFVVGMAGRVPLVTSPELREGFDALLAIGDGVTTLDVALGRTADNLRRTALELGNLLALCGRY
jgi:glycerate kinase